MIDGGLEGPADEPDPLALAAILCAYALDSAGLGLHHAVCQTLVRTLGTPHAETNAVMLPHVVGYVGRHAAEEIGRLAHALGGAGAGPESAAARVAELSARAGVTRLGDLGVHAEAVESVVEAVMRRPEPATTPGAPGPSDVRELLLAAM